MKLRFTFLLVGLFVFIFFLFIFITSKFYAIDLDSSKMIQIFIYGAASTLVVTLATYYLIHTSLRPLNQIVDSIERINGQNLHERISLPQASELLRLTSTLNGMLKRLELSFRTQEEFLGHASHELKTPLAIIKGELDVLRQKDRTPEQIEQFFVSASEELTHLGRLVANLLLLTRIQSGQQTYDGAMTELEEVVMQELPWLDRLARKQDIRILFNMIGLDEALIESANKVSGDAELLGCMVSNVVENSIKYSGTNSTITVLCDFRPERYVELSIKDSGSGIAPEDLPQIFERFYRTPETPKRVHGTGLGLALVKQIARLYKCHLDVKSELGSGTTFTIRFPKSQAPVQNQFTDRR